MSLNRANIRVTAHLWEGLLVALSGSVLLSSELSKVSFVEAGRILARWVRSLQGRYIACIYRRLHGAPIVRQASLTVDQPSGVDRLGVLGCDGQTIVFVDW